MNYIHPSKRMKEGDFKHKQFRASINPNRSLKEKEPYHHCRDRDYYYYRNQERKIDDAIHQNYSALIRHEYCPQSNFLWDPPTFTFAQDKKKSSEKEIK